MANARRVFDALFSSLRQHHEATDSTAWGTRCFAFEAEPFARVHRDGFAVRVDGRHLAEALEVEGAAGCAGRTRGGGAGGLDAESKEP